MKFKRIFLMIIEGIGVGEANDALTYSDNGVKPAIPSVKDRTSIS